MNYEAEFKPEKLASVDTAGILHAMFPTALRTLCGIQFNANGEGLLLPPECPECIRVVRVWASDPDISRCWPTSWNFRPMGVS